MKAPKVFFDITSKQFKTINENEILVTISDGRRSE